MAKRKPSKKKGQKKILLDRINIDLQSVIKWMWILAISAIFFVIALFTLVTFTKLPDIQELENPEFKHATRVFSSDNVELDKYFIENRQWVTYEELSENVINALVSTEDIRFFEHSGIDYRGTARAFVYLGSKGGASTITQQLAKQFFTKKSRNFLKRVWQKCKEWVIALELEKRYTKEEIMAMYLNKYDFLNNSSGIASAARTYFGKDQKNLNIVEAATLIAMLKNPNYYNPKSRPENSTKQREVVLNQMRKAKHITNDEYDTFRQLPINLSNFSIERHWDGIAPSFAAELKKEIRKILNQPEYAKPGGEKYDLYTDGLKIYTTIDSKMQAHAQKAKMKSMAELQETYFKRWSGKDPWTYKVDDKQKASRLQSLRRDVERSARYKRLRDRFLTPIKAKLSKEIDGVRLWDGDINRLLAAEKDDTYLSKLLRQDYISKSQRNVYNKILDSENWNELKVQWNKVQKTAKKQFSTKVKMKVFAYPNGEETVTKTPLDSIRYHKQHMQIGSIAMEPQTGHIKAWVGGVGYKYFQYDHVRINRQVGSTFKPLVYITSMMKQGISPCQKIVDQPYTIEAGEAPFKLMDRWAPENSRNFTRENFTLKEALKKSLNSASVWLIKQLGNVEPIRDVAQSMGIDRDKIPPYPSVCLGTPELSVMEMTGAYGTFANNGIYTEPIFIDRIEDKEGNIIYTGISKKSKALPENYNYAMVDMLKYASSAVRYQLKTEFGGKTGTTDDHVDGWFMGITPNLVVGTWVGGEEQWIRFERLEDGAGGKMARPFYLEFMKRIEADKSLSFNTNAKFKVPEGDLGIVIDCSVYDAMYPAKQDDLKKNRKDQDDFEEPEEEGETAGGLF